MGGSDAIISPEIATFLLGAWGECTADCLHQRTVLCSLGGKTVDDSYCNSLGEWPGNEEPCQSEKCLGSRQEMEHSSDEPSWVSDQVVFEESVSVLEDLASEPISRLPFSGSRLFMNPDPTFLVIGVVLGLFIGLVSLITVKIRKGMKPKVNNAFIYYHSQYEFDNPYCDLTLKYRDEEDKEENLRETDYTVLGL